MFFKNHKRYIKKMKFALKIGSAFFFKVIIVGFKNENQRSNKGLKN